MSSVRAWQDKIGGAHSEATRTCRSPGSLPPSSFRCHPSGTEWLLHHRSPSSVCSLSPGERKTFRSYRVSLAYFLLRHRIRSIQIYDDKIGKRCQLILSYQSYLLICILRMRMNMCADVPKGRSSRSMILFTSDAFNTGVYAGHASSYTKITASRWHFISAHCHTRGLVRLEYDQTVRGTAGH